jgi:hypothetical protein
MAEIDIRDVLMTMHLPVPPPVIDDYAWADDPEAGMAWLRALIAGRLVALREREGRLRRDFDDPERAEVAGRALLLEGAAGTNLLRYERMHELSFHRAYGGLLKGRKEAAETGLPPGAPNEANEPEEGDPTSDAGATSDAGPGPIPGPAGAPTGAFAGEVSARQKSFAQAMATDEADGAKKKTAKTFEVTISVAPDGVASGSRSNPVGGTVVGGDGDRPPVSGPSGG